MEFSLINLSTGFKYITWTRNGGGRLRFRIESLRWISFGVRRLDGIIGCGLRHRVRGSLELLLQKPLHAIPVP